MNCYLDYEVDCPYWALQEGQLDSATIEFFIRGLGTEPNWGTTMKIEGGGDGFPLLVQIPTIDEFRITKGVLSVDKFLKARGVGFVLIYR